MKKKIGILALVIVVLIIFLFNFGIEIGNVRIGKIEKIHTEQREDIENSIFYKKYYSQNKLTCINLWATWCEPCIDEMDSLNITKSNHDDVNFISLSIDQDSLKLKKFISKGKFKFEDITFENLAYRKKIVHLIQNKKSAMLESQSVPVTVLVRNKKILKILDGQVDFKELELAIEKFK